MPRLPQPGADKNIWGDILNDYLSIAHNSDGSLKDIPQSKITNLTSDLASKASIDDLTTAINTRTTPAAVDAKIAAQSTADNAQYAPKSSPTFTGIVTVPTPANPTDATTKSYVDTQVSAGTADATTTTKGKIQLAGDLAGTAASPVIATGAVTSAKIADGTIVDTDINASAAIAQSKIANLVSDLAGKATPAAVDAKIATQAALDAGQYFNKWQTSTAYSAGQLVVNPSGQIVSANTSFTSGVSYSASNWTLVPGIVGTASVTNTPTTGQALIATSSSQAAWSATKTIDTATTPLAPSASPSPGTGTAGASASDHVHPLPTATQLTSVLSSGGVNLYSPLWQAIDSGEITLPRIHTDDSGSYGSTPASGTPHYTYFRAINTATRTTIRFQTAGTAQATNTYTNVALYSVNTSNGALTQIAVATQKALTGTYSGQTFTLTSGVTLTAGTMYAIGFLQVATTVASIAGQWFNGTFMGATPSLAKTSTGGQSSLPASVTPGSAQQFPIYYEVL